MYVCMYVCTYAYIYIFTWINIKTCMFITHCPCLIPLHLYWLHLQIDVAQQVLQRTECWFGYVCVHILLQHSFWCVCTHALFNTSTTLTSIFLSSISSAEDRLTRLSLLLLLRACAASSYSMHVCICVCKCAYTSMDGVYSPVRPIPALQEAMLLHICICACIYDTQQRLNLLLLVHADYVSV